MNLYRLHTKPDVLVGYHTPSTLLWKNRGVDREDGRVSIHRTIKRTHSFNGDIHNPRGPAVITYQYLGSYISSIHLEWWLEGIRYAAAHYHHKDHTTAQRIDYVAQWYHHAEWPFACLKPEKGDVISKWVAKPLTWRSPK